MPQLLIRGLSADLVSRVRAYARARDLSTPDAAAHLLDLGLQTAVGRAAGAAAVNRGRSPEARADAARRAAVARWSRVEPP